MESTLVEMLELAMDTTLEMNTDGVMKFTKDYDAAKHFIETFGKAKLEEYAEQLDPELVTAIREAAKAKEQEFKKQTKGKHFGPKARDHFSLRYLIRHWWLTKVRKVRIESYFD